MIAKAILSWSILLCTASRACTPATNPSSHPPPVRSVVTESAIRAELDRYVCAAWLGDIQLHEVRFADVRCATSASTAQPELQEAVERAVADVSVIVPLAALAYERAYAELEVAGEHTPAQLDAIVRAAYWALAANAAMQTAITELAARNLTVEAVREELVRLLDTPAVRTVACRRLEQTLWFTGLHVTDCSSIKSG